MTAPVRIGQAEPLRDARNRRGRGGAPLKSQEKAEPLHDADWWAEEASRSRTDWVSLAGAALELMEVVGIVGFEPMEAASAHR
jgi:hypothetical protein